VGVAVGGRGVGVRVAVAVGVAVEGLGVLVAVEAAVVGVRVGVLVATGTLPHRAMSSLLETRLVVRRAFAHFTRSWSPGCKTVSELAAKAANIPSASIAEMPITPGKS